MKRTRMMAFAADVAGGLRGWLVCMVAVGCGSSMAVPDASPVADAPLSARLGDASLAPPDAAVSPADGATGATVLPDAPVVADASSLPDTAPPPDAPLEPDAAESFDASLEADAMVAPDASLPDARPDASPDALADATAGPDAAPTYTLKISNFLSWCSITEDGAPYSTSKEFPVDAVVELSAVPIAPFVWGYWTGTDGDLGPEHDTHQMTTVTMTSDKNILACCPTMVDPTCN